MIIKKSTTSALVISLSIIGYPLIAAIAANADIESRGLSIATRGLILTLSLALLLKGDFKSLWNRNTPLVLLMCVTLGAYGCRLLADVIFRSAELGQPSSTYLLFFFGVTLMPVLAILFTTKIDLNAALDLTYLMTIVSALASFLAAQRGIDADAVGQVRGSLDQLNSISLGNVGAILALLSLWKIIQGPRIISLGKLLNVGLFVSGVSLAVFAASRGPLVGIVFAIFALILFQRGYTRVRFILAAAIPIVALGFYALGNSNLNDVLVWQRFQSMLTGQDLSSNIRIDLLTLALEHIKQNPVLGVSIEVVEYRYYPHNLIVEYFMATGVVIGFFIIALFLAVALNARSIISSRNPNGWIPLLFLQSLILAQFSGALYASSTLWITTALVLYLSLEQRGKTKTVQSAAPYKREPEK